MLPCECVVTISADAEWAATKAILRPAEINVSPYGEYFTASVDDRQVLVFHGGWGKIAAAASTEYAIARWQPTVVVNLGTCGGIAGRVRQGAILLVTRTIPYDIHERMGDPEEAIWAYTTEIDVAWLGADVPPGVSKATLVSADRDLVPADIPQLVSRFESIAADWESAAIAYVARRRCVPLVVLRGVSDLVDAERDEAEAAGNLSLFQARCAEVMHTLIGHLGWILRRAVFARDVFVPEVIEVTPAAEPSGF
jgi:adenosylhomocysteine nucleosidase